MESGGHTHMTPLTERYTAAVDLARISHAHDVRKGTQIPYLAHVLAVSSLVLEHGGDEDCAIAALLHDLAEDHGGEEQLRAIADQFGEPVAAIVRSCSDDLPPLGTPKQQWRVRKDRYIAHIADASQPAVLVTAADKLHNLRALINDHLIVGPAVWSRFNPAAGRAGTLWYYRRVADEVSQPLTGTPAEPIVLELGQAIETLCAQVCRIECIDRQTLDREMELFAAPQG